jgi:hypothetical protein
MTIHRSNTVCANPAQALQSVAALFAELGHHRRRIRPAHREDDLPSWAGGARADLAGFDDGAGDTGFGQMQRRRQAREAPADDGDIDIAIRVEHGGLGCRHGSRGPERGGELSRDHRGPGAAWAGAEAAFCCVVMPSSHYQFLAEAGIGFGHAATVEDKAELARLVRTNLTRRLRGRHSADP